MVSVDSHINTSKLHNLRHATPPKQWPAAGSPQRQPVNSAQNHGLILTCYLNLTIVLNIVDIP